MSLAHGLQSQVAIRLCRDDAGDAGDGTISAGTRIELPLLVSHIPPGYQARSLNVQRRLDGIPPRYGQQGGNLPKAQ